MARFDWYQGTARADVSDLRAVLLGVAPSGVWEPLKKAPHGYAFGDRLVDADGPVLSVWWGGMHAHPHFVVSGETAQLAAQVLRADLPAHSVSRADVCIDYADEGAYERLQGLAVSVAKDKGVKVSTAGDHLLTMKGRTCYLGAASSHTRMRLYDKAEELRSKYAADPIRLAAVPEHLARIESQVRPQTREAKSAAALADPLVLMGSAAWMRVLMKLVADIDLHPFEAARSWRQSDDDRAYAALCAQYGGLLRRRREDLGSWDCVGLQIGADLDEREQATKRAKR